eukprot:m.11673 g.11673  ORF g.11673 m.11673 type:complete len:74 (+) comp9871_c0_seq1:114-335(+)
MADQAEARADVNKQLAQALLKVSERVDAMEAKMNRIEEAVDDIKVLLRTAIRQQQQQQQDELEQAVADSNRTS